MRRAREVNVFQFHKGTIKTVPLIYTTNENGNFNSIKVRLKPDIEAVEKYDVTNFNSIKVRLKPISTDSIPKDKPISIP